MKRVVSELSKNVSLDMNGQILIKLQLFNDRGHWHFHKTQKWRKQPSNFWYVYFKIYHYGKKSDALCKQKTVIIHLECYILMESLTSEVFEKWYFSMCKLIMYANELIKYSKWLPNLIGYFIPSTFLGLSEIFWVRTFHTFMVYLYNFLCSYIFNKNEYSMYNLIMYVNKLIKYSKWQPKF